MHSTLLSSGPIAAGIRRLCAPLVLGGLGLSVVACSATPGGGLHGEQVVYHVFNTSGLPVIHAPRLYAGDAGRTLLYANVQSSRTGSANGRASSWVRAEQGSLQADGLRAYPAYDPFGQRSPGFITPLTSFESMPPGDGAPVLPRPLAGVFRAAQRGHRLPDTILVQWREAAQPGRARRSGRLHGPFRYRLRAGLPQSVLNRLGQSWRYRLELAVGASLEGSQIFWRLGRFSNDGITTVERGRFEATPLPGVVGSGAAPAKTL